MGPVPPVTEGQCALNRSEANRQWGSVTFSSATFKRLVSFLFFKIQSNEHELYSFSFAIYV